MKNKFLFYSFKSWIESVASLTGKGEIITLNSQALFAKSFLNNPKNIPFVSVSWPRTLYPINLV